MLALFIIVLVLGTVGTQSRSQHGTRFPAITSRSGACPGYEASNVEESESSLTATLTLIGDCNLYGKDIAKLRLRVEYQKESRLHVLIEDADIQVFQVQEQAVLRPMSEGISSNGSLIQFSYTKSPFTFKVTRTGSNEVLFDTSSKPLVFGDQFIQIRTTLPDNANLYGLGEHSDDFRLPKANYSRTLWNAESPFIPQGKNLYGSHPVYFDHRGEGGTHGVFMLNSNGMDVKLDATNIGRYLEYNTIGGVMDFYFLAGPRPVDVSGQYAEVVGLPAMMPYWVLGFHQCKYGWPTLDHVKQVVTNYSAAGIPLETMWGDIDYMEEHEDFTTDPQRYPLEEYHDFVKTLHENEQHYVMILDPGIHYAARYPTFSRGVSAGAFLKAADGSLYRGRQWAGEVVWPDWFAPNTQSWWTDEILRHFSPDTGIEIDGLWVDMNEASNMCEDVHCMDEADMPSARMTARPREVLPSIGPTPPKLRQGLPNRELFTPPYQISNQYSSLSGRTLFTNITNADGTRQYDTHNLYGHLMAQHTNNALRKLHPTRRPFVLTRSTFASTSRYAAHWFGDNASRWSHYRASITQLLTFSAIHNFPMVGSDICGFNERADEHMCARWAMLGAFQPFYRNHADITAPDQEFYRWPLVTAAAKKAIEARYRLLDYTYTAFHAASDSGIPVAKPLWFAWPADETTFGIQTQWLWGDALVISPVIDDNSTSVAFYLPSGGSTNTKKEVYYDFWTGRQVLVSPQNSNNTAGQITLNNVAFDEIPVHIRGGSIIPLRAQSGLTTAEVRRQNFTILVAPDINGFAKGELYLDDGVSLDVGTNKSEIAFSWDGSTSAFEMSGIFGFTAGVVIESVVVLGQGRDGNGSGGEKAPPRMERVGPWGLNKGFRSQFRF